MKTQNLLPKEKQVHFQDLEDLEQALDDLRHDRKWMFFERIQRAKLSLDCFQAKLTRNILAEEQVFFPFFETHIPRLSPLLAMLRQEHSDLTLCTQALREHLTRLEGSPEDDGMETMQEQSLYLNFLMRIHLLAERTGIYRVADKELHWEEKQLLEQRLRNAPG